MMHGREKSDSAIVAGKPTNKTFPTAAEPVEPRAGAKGNASQQSTHRTQGRERVSQALERVRQAAERKKEKFTALLHHISIDSLRMAFLAVKRDAASGVDGLTWPTYEADLERNLTDLHERVHRGAYRALPSRRVYIPKPDGRQRPLAVAALEDKIVQRATTAVLNAIFPVVRRRASPRLRAAAIERRLVNVVAGIVESAAFVDVVKLIGDHMRQQTAASNGE